MSMLIDTNVYGYAIEEDEKSEDSRRVLEYGKGTGQNPMEV